MENQILPRDEKSEDITSFLTESNKNELNELDINEVIFHKKRNKIIKPIYDPKEELKEKIIELFRNNVRGKEPEISDYNEKHCGKEGHWLEKQMNIKPNGNNEPDLYGFEMKKSSAKITFGDFSASEYLFSRNISHLCTLNHWLEPIIIQRSDFIKYFGNPNPKKNNRYSWSGYCFPTYGIWNTCGQKIDIDESNNIYVLYHFEKDERERKESFPDYLKVSNPIYIAYWKSEDLKEKVERKFNHHGFFICMKNGKKYDKICFGDAFDYEYFIEHMKKRNIFIDSGMYNGNTRNYSQFRSSSQHFWNHLIVEEYS